MYAKFTVIPAFHEIHSIPVGMGAQKVWKFTSDKGLSLSLAEIQALLAFRKESGIRISICTHAHYPHIEAKLKNGTRIEIKGINAAEAMAVLSLPSLLALPREIMQKTGVRVRLIRVNIWKDSSREATASCFFDDPVEIGLNLHRLTDEEVAAVKGSIFSQIQSRDAWPDPSWQRFSASGLSRLMPVLQVG